MRKLVRRILSGHYVTCDRCNGAGGNCPKCGGTGEVFVRD